MKIYTLRHEHRYSNITSDTSLNQYGLKNANSSLIEELNKLNIKTVYSSSFLRCLQTISPYLNNFKKFKKNVETTKTVNLYLPNQKSKPVLNIEYGFCEFLMPSYFNKDSELKTSESYFDYYDLAKPNNKYRPIYSEEKLRSCIPETEVQMKNRVQYTLKTIIKNHKLNSNLKYKNILIVSHMSPIAAIWNYFDSSINYKDEFLDIKMGGIMEFNVE